MQTPPPLPSFHGPFYFFDVNSWLLTTCYSYTGRMNEIFLKWRVAFACAFINFLHFAQMKIMGLQFVATLERYDVDRTQAAFPYVMRYIVAHLSGPFVGYISCKFGLQPVILCGCFVASIGIGLCFFAEDIAVIVLCWGVLNGLGSGMAGHLLPSFMNLHFSAKDFARANGLALAGASLGGFVYPPFYEYLLEAYGASGAFLILSAYTLNTVPAALLLAISPHNSERTPSFVKGVCRSTGSETIRLFSKENEHIACSDIVEIEDHHKTDLNQMSLERRALEDTNLHSRELSRVNCFPISTNVSKTDIRTRENCLMNIEAVAQEDKSIKVLLNVPNATLSGRSSGPEAPKIPNKQKTNIWKAFSVLYNPLFILTTITQSSFIFSLTLHSAVVVDFAKDKGATVNQSVHLLMCSAIAELAGYLLLGFMTDTGWMSTTNFAALCYFCFGLAITAFALVDNFLGMLASVVFSSFAAGGQLLTFPVIVSQYFEKDERNIAMASRFILFVPMSFAGSPLIGIFRDGLGSYEWLFYSLHIFSVFSSVLLLFIPIVAKYRRHRKEVTF